MLEKSKVKCPKCKSNNLNIIEDWHGHNIYWEQINGEFERKNGTLNPGDPFRLFAECSDCNHKWRIRKAIQVTDIIVD